jgi:hypothetical protein
MQSLAAISVPFDMFGEARKTAWHDEERLSQSVIN